MLNTVIEKGIIFLLIFTPLAIGTVQQWAVSIMETAAFIIFGAWLLKMVVEGKVITLKTPLIIFFAAMILLIIFQILPLPGGLLDIISPSAGKAYKKFIDDTDGVWRTISLYSDATKGELFKLLSYAAIFFVIINHYKTEAQANHIVRTIIYMGSFLAVFAVIQKVLWNGKLFWFYPLKAGVHSDMTYIWGPYINHNHFAGYMEMAIPLGLGLLFYKASNIKTLPNISLSKKIASFANSGELAPMVLLALSALIMSAALFLSLSRGGIIGFTVSMLFFIGITRTRRSLKKKAGVFALSGIVIFFLVVMASWSRIEYRFKGVGGEGINRPEIWTDTVGIVKDFPIFGTGLGTFKNIYPGYQTGHSGFLFEHAENDYIEILTDTGFAGFMIVTGMMCVFFYSGIKAWRLRRNLFVKSVAAGGLSSCAAIAAHSFTDFNLRIPANALLLTIIAAITYAAVFNISSNEQRVKQAMSNEQ
ncbi:MAG: O-antigen ligase family protein [Deltaproteobacteria bacterium]|nr:O-antigen ligase family protein [Deltaproteobacteria bacterium]